MENRTTESSKNGKKNNQRKPIIPTIAAGAVIVVLLGGYMAGRMNSGSSMESVGEASEGGASIVSLGTCYDLREGVLTLRDSVNPAEIKGQADLQGAVTSIVAGEGAVLPENCERMFEGYANCKSIDLSGAVISNVKSMKGMCAGCSSLERVTFPASEEYAVSDMSELFSNCTALTSVEWSGLRTNHSVSFERMCEGCSSLKSLNISSFDTSLSTSFAGMFRGCSSLENVDVSHFSFAKTESIAEMFADCKALTVLDVSNWIPGNVTDMSGAFSNCSGLETLLVSEWNTVGCVRFDRMFAGCEKLSLLDLSAFTTPNATSMASMFEGCSSIKSLDLSGFDTSKTTNMESMFTGCNSLVILVLGDHFSKVADDMNLPNGSLGWAKTGGGTQSVSGEGQYAVIENTEKSTYFMQGDPEEIKSDGKVEEIFEDVAAGNWYVEAVQYVYDRKIINGYGGVLFGPADPMTRGMFVTGLYNLDGRPAVDNVVDRFADITGDVYYEKPVEWAFNNQIASGISETAFGPDQPITRQQLATMLYRYAKYAGKDTTYDDTILANYSDQALVADWGMEAMKWAASHKYINGKPTTDGQIVLDPEGIATRAEGAQIIKNFGE